MKATKSDVVDLAAVREARAAARGDLGQALDKIEADPKLLDSDKHVARALARHATAEGFFDLDWREMQAICGAVDRWALLKPWGRLKKRGYVERERYSLGRISGGSGRAENDAGEDRADQLFKVRRGLQSVSYLTPEPHFHKLHVLAKSASLWGVRRPQGRFTPDEIEEAAQALFKLGYLNQLEFRDTADGRECRFVMARFR